MTGNLRLLGSSLVMVGAMLGVVLAEPSSARACKRRPPGLRVTTEVVPADGVIVLAWDCDEACSLAEVANDIVVFEVADESPSPPGEGKPVAGAVERRWLADGFSSWALWRPEQPFTVGRTYSVGTTSNPTQTFMVKAVQQLGFDPRGLLPVARVEPIEQPEGDPICCESDSRHDSCGLPFCFQPRRKSQVWLIFDYGPRPFGQDQWLYRTTFRAGTHPPHVVDSQPAPAYQYEFDEVASEYCYKLEGERIADGELVPIAEACLPAQVESLPTRPLSKLELAEQLIVCNEAPKGYESAWGEASRTIEAAQRADGGVLTASAADVDTSSAADVDADELESASERMDGGCRIGDSRSALGELCGALILLALAARKRQS